MKNLKERAATIKFSAKMIAEATDYSISTIYRVFSGEASPVAINKVEAFIADIEQGVNTMKEKEAKEEKALRDASREFAKLSPFDKALKFDASSLGVSGSSWAKINNTNISQVESQVTDEETQEILGFSIAKTEDLEKQRKFRIDVAYAKATIQNNPAIIRRFGIDKDGKVLKKMRLNDGTLLKKGDQYPLTDEMILLMVGQFEDFKEAEGMNFEIPTVVIKFQYWNKKFNNWCAMTKGPWGFNFKGESNFKLNLWKLDEVKVTTDKDGNKIKVFPKTTNAHVIERDVEEIFEMEENLPVRLRQATRKVVVKGHPDAVKWVPMVDANGNPIMKNGKQRYQMVHDPEGTVIHEQESSIDVIRAYAYRLGYKLDGKKYRAVIECSALDQLVEPTYSDEREYEELTPGVVALRPKVDRHRDSVLTKKESSNLNYRPVSDLSVVSSGNAAWNEKKSNDAEEKKANKYAKRIGNGKAAMKIRYDEHAERTLNKYKNAVGQFNDLFAMDELDALDLVETYKNPKEVVAVAKAMKRLHGKELPYAVYKALNNVRAEAVMVHGHEILNLLKDENQKSATMERLKNNIDLISDVLEVAKKNLAIYNSHKEKYAGVKKEDYNLIEPKLYAVLSKLEKAHGNIA